MSSCKYLIDFSIKDAQQGSSDDDDDLFTVKVKTAAEKVRCTAASVWRVACPDAATEALLICRKLKRRSTGSL